MEHFTCMLFLKRELCFRYFNQKGVVRQLTRYHTKQSQQYHTVKNKFGSLILRGCNFRNISATLL